MQLNYFMWLVILCFPWLIECCVSPKAAEKEAHLVRQEEERAEQRRKAKADKKAQKKSQKTNRTGDKRKAEDDGGDEWGDETGKSGVAIEQTFSYMYIGFHLHATEYTLISDIIYIIPHLFTSDYEF